MTGDGDGEGAIKEPPKPLKKKSVREVRTLESAFLDCVYQNLSLQRVE